MQICQVFTNPGLQVCLCPTFGSQTNSLGSTYPVWWRWECDCMWLTVFEI